MFWLLTAAATSVAALAYAVELLFYPLPHVKGIPTVPFWVALLPLVKDIDQMDVFKAYIEEPLRKHGAVKIFFASQWNIIVHHPRYLAEVLKHTSIYEKSGNDEKIPHSVLASLLGNNIISGRGDTWKTYQRVIKPGLQARQDLGRLQDNATKLRNMILDQLEESGSAKLHSIVQKHTINNFTDIFYNTDTKASGVPLDQMQTQLKREIFKPLFMSFPVLDRIGLSTRENARRLASQFTDTLISLLGTGAGTRLTQDLLEARANGALTEKQFRDNVTVLFVAGQENPQLATISTLYLLAKHPDIQQQLYEEIVNHDTLNGGTEITEETLQAMPLLTAVVLESIRLFPPIGQLINRRTTTSVCLGGDIFIPKGTYVGYNCVSTNRDLEAWGANANEFVPNRWGCSSEEIRREYRQRKARAEFLSFHGGQRACLGEKFALLQLRVTLCVLVRSVQWTLDPAWPERMTPAGPLCPRNLQLKFTARASGGQV